MNENERERERERERKKERKKLIEEVVGRDSKSHFECSSQMFYL